MADDVFQVKEEWLDYVTIGCKEKGVNVDEEATDATGGRDPAFRIKKIKTEDGPDQAETVKEELEHDVTECTELESLSPTMSQVEVDTETEPHVTTSPDRSGESDVKVTLEKPYQCAVCDYRCSHKGTLKVHLRIHSGEKPFVCHFCYHSFARAVDLKVHIMSHTGEKPFVCNLCDHSFANAFLLKRHMRTHTGEKPYLCTICDKSFSQKHSLDIHMRTHTGGKPFPCNICGNSFSQKPNLEAHIRIHTGEKPFSCNVCE